MAKITIAQLQTSDSYISELTSTELDATKGGAGAGAGAGLIDLINAAVAADNILNGSANNLLAGGVQGNQIVVGSGSNGRNAGENYNNQPSA